MCINTINTVIDMIILVDLFWIIIHQGTWIVGTMILTELNENMLLETLEDDYETCSFLSEAHI